LTKFIFNLGKDFKRKKFQTAKFSVLVWEYTTDLSSGFDSIWYTALFHQLIALDYPLSLVVHIHFF